MPPFTIQVEGFSFYDAPDAEGIDGRATYLILAPCDETPCTHVCKTHPRMKHMYEGQPFRLGSVGHRIGASAAEIRENRANVWGWNGNREHPTLTPSLRGNRLAAGLGYHLHIQLTAGKIHLYNDSENLIVHPLPVRCIVEE